MSWDTAKEFIGHAGWGTQLYKDTLLQLPRHTKRGGYDAYHLHTSNNKMQNKFNVYN